MNSRTASRALRACAKQLSAPTTQRRTFVSALNAASRATVATAQRPVQLSAQQTRGVKTIDFAGVKEDVYGKAKRASIEFDLY